MAQKVISFFRLVRWINLLYIALTQWLIYSCLNLAFLKDAYKSPQLSLGLLFVLILSTVLIAAAGYIINDYFDIKADELNKPNRIFINRIFSRRAAMIWHALFNILGIGLGFFVAYWVGNFYLGFIHVLVWGGLWYYSVALKKQLLTGNLLVSVLTALVVVIVGVFEVNISVANVGQNIAEPYFIYLYGYAFFAFSMNFQREIVKDMEDIEGDQLIGGQTMPIKLGVHRAKQATALVIVLTVLVLGAYQFFAVQFHGSKAYAVVAYCSVALQLPLSYLLVQLFKADKASDFKYISNWQKAIMLLGILLLPIIRYQLLN